MLITPWWPVAVEVINPSYSVLADERRVKLMFHLSQKFEMGAKNNITFELTTFASEKHDGRLHCRRIPADGSNNMCLFVAKCYITTGRCCTIPPQ